MNDEDDPELLLCFLKPGSMAHWRLSNQIALDRLIDRCKLWKHDVFPTYKGPNNDKIPCGEGQKPVISVPVERKPPPRKPRRGDVVEQDDNKGYIVWVGEDDVGVRWLDDPVADSIDLDQFYEYTSRGRTTIWIL